MSVTSARYIDAKHTLIEAIIDGVLTQELGGGAGDPRIREWIEQGNAPDAYVAPAPVPVTVFEGATFLQRVTDAEYAAITASTNIQLRRWLDTFRLRGEIDVSGETAQAAKAGLVKLGLLTTDRADVIFAPA
jgi:hypothetical protein